MIHRSGAGFIIYRKFKNGIRFLGLKGPKEIRESRNGTWDFPKGVLESNETIWQCAQREAFEECGIFVIESDIRAGPHEISSCIIFLIETDSVPEITPNPISGTLEHEGWEWLTADTLEGDCYVWLRPFVRWAREILSI